MILNKKTHNLYSLKLKQSNHILRFGQFGIKIMSFTRITTEQVKALERSFSQVIKKITKKKHSIKVWNLITLNNCLTKLSSESRMGKGKGAIYTKSTFLKPGTILFEFDGISYQQMLYIFTFVKNKISFKISLITKYD